MQVNIDSLDVQMPLGNNGVTFAVFNNDDEFLGKLRVERGVIEWCKGKTKIGNGASVTWGQLIAYFEKDDEREVDFETGLR